METSQPRQPSSARPRPQHDPNNHLVYSNRSLCYGKLGRHTLALEDARTVVAIMPTWPKGFARLAAALEELGQHAEAVKAYEQAAWLAQSRDGDAAAVAEYEAAVERVRRSAYTGAARRAGSRPSRRPCRAMRAMEHCAVSLTIPTRARVPQGRGEIPITMVVGDTVRQSPLLQSRVRNGDSCADSLGCEGRLRHCLYGSSDRASDAWKASCS